MKLELYLSNLQVSAEGNVDEVCNEVCQIFEALPSRKAASLHDFDIVFVVGK